MGSNLIGVREDQDLLRAETEISLTKCLLAFHQSISYNIP